MSAAEVIYPRQFGAHGRVEPTVWFSAAELADLRLPGLPADKRSIQRRAVDERWGERHSLAGEPLSRTRPGRGGGLEFHIELLPIAAREELIRRGIASAEAAEVETPSEADALWEWFGAQPDKVKAQAQVRLDAVSGVYLLAETLKVGKAAAVAAIAKKEGISTATLWSWIKAVSAVERKDWLPALAPRRKGGGKAAEIPEELWQLYKSDWLRLSAPPAAASYDVVRRRARSMGIALPSIKAFQRRIAREIDPYVVILMREGPDCRFALRIDPGGA